MASLALPRPGLLARLATALEEGVLMMGRRDPRTRAGKRFRGSNGVTRPKPARATGWWSGVEGVDGVPPVPAPPPPGGKRTPPPQ